MPNKLDILVSGKAIANKILAALPSHTLAEILPYFEGAELRPGQTLCQPNGKIRRAHFIQGGFVVFTKMMRDGRSTMIGFAGTEGMTPSHVLNGSPPSDIECIVQIPGASLAIDPNVLYGLAQRIPSLRQGLERYWQFMDEQIAQLSGCNRLHSLEQRCARFLLTMSDNAAAETFSLTQEDLAIMLGAQRPHVSAVAANFQNMSLIQYRHGRMQVTNRNGLKVASCECYDVIRDMIAGGFPMRHDHDRGLQVSSKPVCVTAGCPDRRD